jgi:hypothetical protein
VIYELAPGLKVASVTNTPEFLQWFVAHGVPNPMLAVEKDLDRLKAGIDVWRPPESDHSPVSKR